MFEPRVWMAALATAAASLVTFAPAAAVPLPLSDAQLLADARKEGSVTFYGSMFAPQLQAVAARFQQESGIRVDVLRMESNALPARVAIEAKSGTPHADVIQEPGFQMDLLKRQQFLVKYQPPENADFTAGTFDPDGYWSSFCVNTETLSYNPKVVAAAGIKPPQSWFDFVKPEWKGRFALFSGSYEWYAAMQRAYGKDKADGYMRSLAANGVHMVNSHQLAETLMESGEYAAAVNSYGYSMAHDQAQGLSVVEVNPDPTIVEVLAIGVSASAPHPNAARLFVRWMLSRPTQTWIVAELNRISARKDVKNNPVVWNPKIHYLISNPSDSVHYSDYMHDFNAIFGIAGTS